MRKQRRKPRRDELSDIKQALARDNTGGVLLSTKEAQDYLGVKRHLFLYHIKPDLNVLKLGKGNYYARLDLDAWVARKIATPKSHAITLR